MAIEDQAPNCVLCHVRACHEKPGDRRPPAFCPMVTEPELLEDVEKSLYQQEDIRRLALHAARSVEANGGRWTRVESIIDFARRIEAQRLGIAHCSAMMEEAKVARDIFVAQGFDVCTVACCVGAFDRRRLDSKEGEELCPEGYRNLCNPVGQAAVLERAGTQFNIVMGLCLGHDSLFFMYSKAPTTVLVVKDPVLVHNPVAALYASRTFYRRLMKRWPPEK